MTRNICKSRKDWHFSQRIDDQRPWNQLEEIDYIYTKGFQIIKTGCLTDSCDGRFPSDHFPLEADLRFNE